MRLFRQLFLHLVVGTGAIGDVERAGFVECYRDRSIDEWWSGDFLNLKSVRDGKRVFAEFHLCGSSHDGEAQEKDWAEHRRAALQTGSDLPRKTISFAKRKTPAPFP